MATASIKNFFKGVTNTDLEPLSYSTNDEFKFISYPKQTTNQEENAKFLTELDNSIKQYDEESAKCNEKIIQAQDKYHFLNSKIPQAQDKYHFLNSKIPQAVKGKVDTLGISQIRFTDFLDKSDDSEKVTNEHESKSFFSSFNSPLNKIYDFGAKSFGIIKNATSILSSKITETFNFVNNKVLSYLDSNTEETFNFLDQIENLSDDQLVEEIINTPEEELDAVFEKMTYEKLAELINNAPNEKAQELVNYIMPWHLEKVIDSISSDKLIEQELKKLSNENISDEQLKNIISLAGEEKLAEKLDIIPNENLERIISNISNDQLATMINNASDENLERIVDSISDQNLPMILHLLPAEKVKQIMILIHGEEVVEQLEKQQLLEEILNTAERELDEIKTTKLDELIGDIPNDKLATIINNALDENLERIVDIIDSDEHNLSESLVKQIINLLYDKKYIQQEVEQYNSDFNIKLSGESDNDSGIYSDFEDVIEV